MGIADTILSLHPGDNLGARYELIRIIGRGGMGVVWLALDHRLDARPVALKVLPAALSTDKRAVARLKAEAVRNMDLTHPNIVRLHTFDQDPTRQDVAFLVMQYIEGQTLNDLLADHPDGLPTKRVRVWFDQIARAIDHAHSKGILHRDIKPGNIIIEAKTNTAYLMDFGIGREARDTMTRVTGLQDSSGTLPYMSPQQLMGKNDTSNDIYSFAATLYEALSGNPPFHTGDIAYQIRHAEPEPIAHMNGLLNAALQRGLRKESSERPSSCRGLLTRDGTPTSPMSSKPARIRADSSQVAARHLDRKTVDLASGVTAEFVFIDAPRVAPDGFLMGSPSGEKGREKLCDNALKIARLINSIHDSSIEGRTDSPAGEKRRSDDETQFRAVLTKGYWLQTTEVTQGQWEAVMGSNPSSFKLGTNHPVEAVSWDDCQEFIAELRQRGIGARLPTEAQWEFACRAGTTTPFNTGATISTEQANYNGKYTYGNGRKGKYSEQTTPVGSFASNAWGLHDMHGNVCEWCEDGYEWYPKGTVKDPVGPQTSSDRVLRGGSWYVIPWYLRSANRGRSSPANHFNNVGLRLTLDSE